MCIYCPSRCDPMGGWSDPTFYQGKVDVCWGLPQDLVSCILWMRYRRETVCEYTKPSGNGYTKLLLREQQQICNWKKGGLSIDKFVSEDYGKGEWNINSDVSYKIFRGVFPWIVQLVPWSEAYDNFYHLNNKLYAKVLKTIARLRGIAFLIRLG